MTTSEALIKLVRDCLEAEKLHDGTKVALESLINAYRAQVKCSLRLEQTIHEMRK